MKPIIPKSIDVAVMVIAEIAIAKFASGVSRKRIFSGREVGENAVIGVCLFFILLLMYYTT